MGFQSYKDLTVWQAAVDLVIEIYSLTGSFPKHELYGLGSQIQRCAVSVPSNIAEGHARDSTREFLHHVSIALGSMAELETQLVIAERLGYSTPTSVAQLSARADEIGKMLRGLQKRLKQKLGARD